MRKSLERVERKEREEKKSQVNESEKIICRRKKEKFERAWHEKRKESITLFYFLFPSFFLLFLAGDKYESFLVDSSYKMYMRLKIRNLTKSDFGVFKCVAKNSLGETDGNIKIYGK